MTRPPLNYLVSPWPQTLPDVARYMLCSAAMAGCVYGLIWLISFWGAMGGMER